MREKDEPLKNTKALLPLLLMVFVIGACSFSKLSKTRTALIVPEAASATASLTIPAPQIPARTFRIPDYGAVGDGKTLNTAALKKAVAACTAAGGGVVVVPPGRFLTGPFSLASSMELRVEKGATLLLSDKPSDYVVTNNRYENCITVNDSHDVAITGGGTIDGQGAVWWAKFTAGTDTNHRPFLVVMNRCQRVLVKDITLANSPMFHLVPQRCQDVRIDGIHITAPLIGKNTDGIDPSGWNFLITGCTFDVGDDCIALKPSGRIDEGQPSCKNFLIQNCTFLHGHGLSVGGQTPGGLDGMTVQNCTFHGTDAGIRLKAPRGEGGLVENLTYENLTMTDVKVAILITSYYPKIPLIPRQTPFSLSARRRRSGGISASAMSRRRGAGQRARSSACRRCRFPILC